MTILFLGKLKVKSCCGQNNLNNFFNCPIGDTKPLLPIIAFSLLHPHFASKAGKKLILVHANNTFKIAIVFWVICFVKFYNVFLPFMIMLACVGGRRKRVFVGLVVGTTQILLLLLLACLVAIIFRVSNVFACTLLSLSKHFFAHNLLIILDALVPLEVRWT